MGMTMTQKILAAHLLSGELIPGTEISIRIDQTLTQDSTGTMAYLQFEAMGVKRVKTEKSIAYIDHNTLQTGFENADDHQYIQSVAKKHGIWCSKPGNGICHQVQLERIGKPGKTLLGSDSHTPTGGALGMIAEKRVAFVPQNEELMTHAAKISPEEEWIDWSMDAKRIHNIIRGLTPAPGAKSVLRIEGKDDLALRIEPGQPAEQGSDAAPGTVLGMDGDALLIACGTGTYRMTHLHPAGKSTMSAKDFFNGRLRGLPAPYGMLGGK